MKIHSRTKPIMSLLICFFSVINSVQSQEELNNSKIETSNVTFIKEKGFDGYLFSKDYFVLFSITSQKERYSPTKEDIIIAETLISEKLAKMNKNKINQGEGCPIIHNKLKNYTRQYLGFINKEGDKIIWLNFIWKSKFEADELSEDIISVFDGCSYYWNIKVNLNKEKLFDLQVNGIG